jgi:hypothetical protein
MRAREMMAKLDRLPTPKSEAKSWDVSLLSPEKQDRYSELSELIRQSKDINSRSLDGVFLELIDLVDDLPLLGPHDPQQGPLIEVPGTLARYWQLPPGASKWRSYNFCKLSKVQTLRFVELCEQYGFANETDLKAQMLPLHAWPDCDRSELQDMLDIAAS